MDASCHWAVLEYVSLEDNSVETKTTHQVVGQEPIMVS